MAEAIDQPGQRLTRAQAMQDDIISVNVQRMDTYHKQQTIGTERVWLQVKGTTVGACAGRKRQQEAQ